MRFRFRFNALMILITLLFFSVFSALSLWQVGRVFDKQATVDQIELANKHSALNISDKSDEYLLAHLHYRATVNGRFAVDECFFVENVVRKGRPGLYFYCLFKPTLGDRSLLVNMGWIKRGNDRLELPELELVSGQMIIEGVLKQPRSKPVVTSGLDKPNTELQNLWVYFDFESLKKQSSMDFYPLELQLLSDINPHLVRDWPGFNAEIGMHIGYAIHWAVFALVTLGLFIKFNVKRIDRDD